MNCTFNLLSTHILPHFQVEIMQLDFASSEAPSYYQALSLNYLNTKAIVKLKFTHFE